MAGMFDPQSAVEGGTRRWTPSHLYQNPDDAAEMNAAGAGAKIVAPPPALPPAPYTGKEYGQRKAPAGSIEEKVVKKAGQRGLLPPDELLKSLGR